MEKHLFGRGSTTSIGEISIERGGDIIATRKGGLEVNC
jgi:hypothetical protein